jgi:hypothetical protein
MANRDEIMRSLAMVCRQSPAATLWTLGYLAQGTSTEVLSEALEGAQEAREVWGGSDHLVAYAERWGRVPDQPL